MTAEESTIKEKLDKILFQRIAKGDAQAFEAFYDNVSNIVYGHSLKMLHNKQNATLVLQEVFIELWDRRKSLTSVEHPRTFLFKILAKGLYPYLIAHLTSRLQLTA